MKSIISATKHIGFFTIALTLALATNLAYGQWANPTAVAPADNAAAPINTSATDQIKTGSFGANELIAATKVRSDQYCDFDGFNCFSPSSVSSTTVINTPNAGLGLGYNQTWQEVVRTQGVWYQNSTGQPIMVFHKNIWNGTVVSIGPSTSDFVQLHYGDYDSDLDNGSTFIVPVGHWYQFQTDTGNPSNGHREVLELRSVPFMTACEVEFYYKARNDTGTSIRTLLRPITGGDAAIGMWQHKDDNLNLHFTEQLGFDIWGASTFDHGERIGVGFISNKDYLENQADIEYKDAAGLNNNHYIVEQFSLVAGETASFVSLAVDGVPAGYGEMTATVLGCTDL